MTSENIVTLILAAIILLIVFPDVRNNIFKTLARLIKMEFDDNETTSNDDEAGAFIYTILDKNGIVEELMVDESIIGLLDQLNSWNGTKLPHDKLLAEFDNKNSDLYGYRIVKQRRTLCNLDSDDLDIVDKLKAGEKLDDDNAKIVS